MKLQFIRNLSVVIMLLAGATSYLTQQALFLTWKVDPFTAAVAPISIDLLAVICALAVHAETITLGGRLTAIFVLLVAGSGSMVANWIAGATIGAKAVHLAMVVAYLLAESVASQTKSKSKKAGSVVAPEYVESGAVRAATPELVASDAVSQDLPEAPVSPAPVVQSSREPARPAPRKAPVSPLTKRPLGV